MPSANRNQKNAGYFFHKNKLMAKKIGFHPFPSFSSFPSELFIGTRCGRALDGLGAFQHASCIPLHLAREEPLDASPTFLVTESPKSQASLVGKDGFQSFNLVNVIFNDKLKYHHWLGFNPLVIYVMNVLSPYSIASIYIFMKKINLRVL